MQIDPISVAGGLAASYTDPFQWMFALAAAALGWSRRPWLAAGLIAIYLAVKVAAIGALIGHVAVVDVAFIALNYFIGWLLGRAFRIERPH
jgi:hypothetical protein